MAVRAWTYISISNVFLSVGVVVFVVVALTPMGLVAVGGVMQIVDAFSCS